MSGHPLAVGAGAGAGSLTRLSSRGSVEPTASSLLDLLYLFKHYLAIELRNRLATLSLKGGSRALLQTFDPAASVAAEHDNSRPALSLHQGLVRIADLPDRAESAPNSDVGRRQQESHQKQKASEQRKPFLWILGDASELWTTFS